MNLLEDELTDKKNFSQNLAGYSNQLKLLLLFLWRGWDRKYNYKIGTEFKPAEKFDDLVFFSLTENGQQDFAICLQAKHTRNEAAILQYDHFVSDDNNTAICNLRKYFISFRKILQQNHFFPNEYILCNNYYMPNSKMLENVKNAADFICFKSGNDDCNSVIKDMFSDSSGIWECHKLDTLSDNVESMLHNLSNLRILGQELINSVIDCEKKGLKHVNLDLRKYWISLYYRAFFNDNVITKNEFVIFKKQFIDLNHQIEEEPFRHIFFDEYSKKADWNYIKNVRFNATFVNALKQTQEKQTSNSKNDQIEDSIDLCIEETKAANSEDDEYQKLAKALVNQALNPFNSTVDPIILKNIETIKKIVECVEQLTFSDDFLGNPQNKFLQIVLEKYTLSETFKKETTNILFENESNYVMDNHSEKMSERESDDMAQELAHCFLLKQKISNSVSTKCGRFLKVIDNGMKLIFNLRPNEKEKVFYSEFLTSYARERLKHMEIKFTNPKVDEVIKDVIKVFLNSNSKLDVKKFETDRTYGELEILIEELFDINVENNYIQLKKSYFENNVPLSKNAKKFRDNLEKRRSDLRRSWIKYFKIKIKTWDDLFLEHKDWVTEKITLLAEEIKNLLENRIEGQNFLIYDKEKCKKNETQGLLQDLFGEHIKKREYDAQKLADKTQRVGSREDWLILTTNFFDKITASEKAEIFKSKFKNFDMKKFYGIITIKSLFNKANPNDKELQRLRQDLSAEILDLINTKQNNYDRLIIYNRFNFQRNGTAGFLEHLIGSVFEENRNILSFKSEGDMFVKVLLQDYSKELLQKFKDRKIELTKTLYDFKELAEELGSSINVNDSQCTVLKYFGINSNAMQALSESVFVSTNIPNEIKFNSHFLECEKWSKEAHEFRQILEDKLSFRAFKSLEEKQFLINISFDDKGKKFRNPIEIATTMANEMLKLLEKNPTENIFSFDIVYCDIYKLNTIGEKSGQNLSLSLTQFMPKSSATSIISTPSETIKSIMDCIFVESETLGMKKMRKIFFKYGNWSNNVETFREKLRNQFKSIDLSALKNLVIKTENFPFCCDCLIESGDITNEVQEFKKKLLIVTSPGEERLSEIISKEIDDELNLTNDDSASKLLLIKVINWAKEKEGRLLTKEDMIKFMGEIKGKMYSIMAAGFLYRGKLRKYNISFNNINIDIAIKAYLQSDGKILILESNFIQLTAIKTDKVLRKEPKCHGINSLIFHKLSQLPLLDTYEIKGKILNIISSAFSSDQRSNLLVVVDDSSKSNVLKNFMFLNSLLNSALKKQNKKFIFITDSCSDFTELLRNDNFYSEFNIEKQVDHIRFSDLTEDSQAILIRQDVTFKGLKICTSSKSKEYDPEIYIERLVGSINIDHKFFEKCNELNKNDLNSFHHIFIFYEIRENDLEKILKSYGIEPNKREKFTYLSMEELKSPYVCESHITYETLKEMYLQHTVHRITIIEETVEKANNVIYQAYVSEEYFLHYVSHNKIVYINDSAGMGKSTILSSFEEKIKRTKMLKWIIRLNMNDCAKELRNARISNIDQEFDFHFPKHVERYEDVLLNSLTKGETFEGNQMTFENDVFKFMFENGMVTVVIDGYDEIGAEYRKIVTSWINRLKNKTRNQVWISSRTDYKTEIEGNFKISGYSLYQLKIYEQKKMLYKIWRRKWPKKFNEDMELYMNSYAGQLLYKFAVIVKSNKEYAGNPLHIIMLSDLFWKNTDEGEKTWLGCYEYVSSKGKGDANIDEKLQNLFILYDTFLRRKIEEFYFLDKNIYPSIEDSVIAKKDKNYKKSHQMCCILGMVAMTEVNTYNIFLEEKERTMLEKWCNNNMRENMGILCTAPNDKDPVFVYYIYAEYFAACYLTNKLALVSKKHKLVLDVISSILKNDVVVFSYCVKHLLSQKFKKETDLQKEINDYIFNNRLNGYFLIKWLMDEKKINEKFPKQDSLGRTYLHYAVLSGNLQNVIYVLLNTYDLIIKQTADNDFDTAIFLLAEYIIVRDKNENTALIYAKNEIYALLKDIRDIGPRRIAPNNYDGNVIKIITEMSQRDETTNLRHDQKRFDFVQVLFCNISFSSIWCIHKNAGNGILEMLHNLGRNYLELFDYLCTTEDITNKEKLNIAETWCKRNGIKENVAKKMLTVSVENDCHNVFDYFRNVLENDNMAVLILDLFFAACKANIFPFVEFFLKQNYTEIDEYSLLNNHFVKSVSNLNIVEHIIEKTKPDLYMLIRHKWYDETLMEVMGSDFVIRIIEHFLDKEADLSIFNEYSDQVWDYAFDKDDDILIQRLLKNNILQVSEKQKHRTITAISYYFDKDYNINDKINGECRLLKAMNSGNRKLFTFLLKKGADVNVKFQNGKTLLHIACEKRDLKFFKLLLGFGAAYDVIDKEERKSFGYNSYTILYKLGQLDFAFNNLKTIGFNENLKNDENYFIDEISDNKREYLHLSTTNQEKETLWHVAVAGDNLYELNDEKQEELDEYIDVINNKDKNGNTPLHLAVIAEKFSYVEYLLNKGAHYNTKNNEEKNAEDLAQNGSEIQILLKQIRMLFHNTEYSDIDKWKKFITNSVVLIGHSSDDVVVRGFINISNLEKLKNCDTENLLHKAAQNSDLNVFKYLVQFMFNKDVKAQKRTLCKKEYQDILLCLIKKDKLNKCKNLLEEGVPFNNAEFKLKKILYNNKCAIEFDKIRELFDDLYKENFIIVKYKMEYEKFEIDVINVRDYKGKTISDYAQHTTNYEFMIFLMNHGVKIENLDEVKNKKMKQVILSRSILNKKNNLT